MMTKQEHIDYWVKTANNDWSAVQKMYQSKVYIQGLFFAHLYLEKLCKALWVKNNIENTPPRVHNLIKVLDEAKIFYTQDQKDFMNIMNGFQLEGWYPDYLNRLYNLYKKKYRRNFRTSKNFWFMASAAIMKQMKDFVKQVKAEDGITLRKAILFGSYARNTQTKYSDIDMALVADEFCNVPTEDIKLFLKAMREYYMVQPQTYNTNDFTPDKDPFVEEILRTGIEIV